MYQMHDVGSTLGVSISEKAKALGISLPKRQYPGDAGFDLQTIERVVVEPGMVGRFPTGLNWNLPGHDVTGPWQICLEILPRTGLAAGKGLYPMAWIVDSGYRAQDENGLTLALRNLGQETLTFEVGDRVAQGLLVPIWTPRLVEITQEAVDETDRGGGRLGSTGIKGGAVHEEKTVQSMVLIRDAESQQLVKATVTIQGDVEHWEIPSASRHWKMTSADRAKCAQRKYRTRSFSTSRGNSEIEWHIYFPRGRIEKPSFQWVPPRLH